VVERVVEKPVTIPVLQQAIADVAEKLEANELLSSSVTEASLS
jgi:hypothetical protein